jgi:hypothetical protein
MQGHWWIILATALLGLSAIAVLWRPLLTSWREARFSEACRDFHLQRERLEAKFMILGMVEDRAEEDRWSDCRFDDDVAYARSRASGELSAFVAVTIHLDEPSDPMMVASDLGDTSCEATAVFRFDGRHWNTEGRAIFNLTPTEAIHFFERDLEMVGQELAHRS